MFFCFELWVPHCIVYIGWRVTRCCSTYAISLSANPKGLTLCGGAPPNMVAAGGNQGSSVERVGIIPTWCQLPWRCASAWYQVLKRRRAIAFRDHLHSVRLLNLHCANHISCYIFLFSSNNHLRPVCCTRVCVFICRFVCECTYMAYASHAVDASAVFYFCNKRIVARECKCSATRPDLCSNMAKSLKCGMRTWIIPQLIHSRGVKYWSNHSRYVLMVGFERISEKIGCVFKK